MSSNDSPQKFPKARVYGDAAALVFEADSTRQGDPTVRVEAALALPGRDDYDWGQKIGFQLSRRELPVMTAVLLGLLPQCEFQGHGEGRDKGLVLMNQHTHLFCRVFARDQRVRAVPVQPSDALYVAGIFLRQLRAAMPWLAGGDVMMLLKATVARLGRQVY